MTSRRLKQFLVAGTILLAVLISARQTALSKTRKVEQRHNVESGVAERKNAESLFAKSHSLLAYLAGHVENHRLSWKELRQLVQNVVRGGRFSTPEYRNTLAWLDYLELKGDRLRHLFRLTYDRQTDDNTGSLVFLHQGNALLTPVQQSMWRHCKLNFQNRHADFQLQLVSGYHSSAYQVLVLSRASGELKKALKRTPLPGYSRHQKTVPDITVALLHKKAGAFPVQKMRENLLEVCRPFGFVRVKTQTGKTETELGFIGYDRLYHSILTNEIIPRRLKYNFLNAMERTGFYPSPDGMRVLMALSAQESSMSWNPRLNNRKKEALRKRFKRILGTLENSLGGRLTEFIFSDELNSEKKQLIKELERITDPANQKIREYDVYLWTREVAGFLQQLLRENRRLTQIGEWFYELEQLAEQIRYEPQTFGLWQINANHLSERIERHQQLHRRFPEIFTKEGDQWLVMRSRMIDVLSGRPDSVLDRQRGLELIIHTYLQPRYRSHLLGDRDDLTYFIVENVAGEMSTFRAAIQQKLNDSIGTSLELDGDLSYYQPYSTRINWEKTSNTQKAFRKFIEIRYAYFTRPVDPWKLVKKLCEAEDWAELQESELYRRIMRKERGKRIFPNIRSELYQQTPKIYADVVWRKSRLF